MNKQKIKQHLRRAFFALAMVGALLVLPPANADRPQHPGTASGDVVACEQLTDVTYIGNLEIDTLSACATFSGTFNGTLEGTETDTIHPDGSLFVQFTGVFNGSVAGSPVGSAVLTAIGTGGFHGHSAMSLTNVIGQGSGGLVGLHALVTLGLPIDSPPPPDTCGLTCDFSFTTQYSGQFQFAP
jgi:hypothetical protein